MNTHPHICYGLLARFRTSDLFALLDNTKHVHRAYREMRAVILIELAYRLRLRKPWVADAIWKLLSQKFFHFEHASLITH